MTESILCAAVWCKDIEWASILKDSEDFDKRLILPVNCDKGIVFCGFRHPHCLYTMVATTGLLQHEAGEEIQGFLTNKNRFVDREEAYQIAIEAKQITEGKYSSKTLYSEDLY